MFIFAVFKKNGNTVVSFNSLEYWSSKKSLKYNYSDIEKNILNPILTKYKLDELAESMYISNIKKSVKEWRTLLISEECLCYNKEFEDFLRDAL